MVSPAVISTVLAKAIEVASHSWEYGTVAEALLEWHSPNLTIWHDPFPSGQIPTLNIDDVSALSYVKPFISTNGPTLVEGDGKSNKQQDLQTKRFKTADKKIQAQQAIPPPSVPSRY